MDLWIQASGSPAGTGVVEGLAPQGPPPLLLLLDLTPGIEGVPGCLDLRESSGILASQVLREKHFHPQILLERRN